MNIRIITASLSRNAGGLFDAIRFLYQSFKDDVVIFGLEDKFTSLDKAGWDSIGTQSFKICGFKNFGYSYTLKKKVLGESIDLLHLHGIWMYPQMVAYQWQKEYNKPLVISPHGMLDPWAVKNSSWKKKLIGLLFADKSLKKASCLHALCQSEYESIRTFGLKNPVAIIPNGINLPLLNKAPVDPLRNYNKKTLLFIGRIHPKKGLILLIEAFAKLKNDGCEQLKDWQLKIVGWDQLNHKDDLIKLVENNNLTSDIEFIGPLFDKDKEVALLNADAFILPSYSEGLPMSILEAWSYKLPVLMTKECNIPEGFTSKSAIKIDLNIEDITNKLIIFFSLSESQRKEIGENGYNLVKSKFTWSKIASDMEDAYKWLLNKGEKPSFVLLD